MPVFAARDLTPKLTALIAAGMICLSTSPLLAADDEAPAKGAAVTVLKAAKSCFANIVEVSGTIIAREENQVRPERMGLKVAEVMVDAGDSVTAGQVLARLNLPEGGQITVQAPVARGDLGLDGVASARWRRARAKRCSRSSRAASSTWSAWCRRATSRSFRSTRPRGSR